MTKKIYIAFDVNKNPTAVVSADSRRDANIALSFMKGEVHTLEEIDINNGPDVGFLLTSVQANSNEFSHRIGGVDFRLWKRGI